MTVVGADIATARLPPAPFRVVANPPWALAETVSRRCSLAVARPRRPRPPPLARPSLGGRDSRIGVGARCTPSRSSRRARPAPRSPSSTADDPRYRAARRRRASIRRPAVRLRHAAAGPPAVAVPRAVRRRHRPAEVGGRDLRHRVRLAGRRVRRPRPDVVPGTLVDLVGAVAEALARARRGRGHSHRSAAAHRRHHHRRRPRLDLPLRPAGGPLDVVGIAAWTRIRRTLGPEILRSRTSQRHFTSHFKT